MRGGTAERPSPYGFGRYCPVASKDPTWRSWGRSSPSRSHDRDGRISRKRSPVLATACAPMQPRGSPGSRCRITPAAAANTSWPLRCPPARPRAERARRTPRHQRRRRRDQLVNVKGGSHRRGGPDVSARSTQRPPLPRPIQPQSDRLSRREIRRPNRQVDLRLSLARRRHARPSGERQGRAP